MTWAENRYKQSAFDRKRGIKPAVLQLLEGRVVRRFMCQRIAVKELGIPQGNISLTLNEKRKTTHGYGFIYEETPTTDKEREK